MKALSLSVGMALWAAGLFAVLQLQELPDSLLGTHGVCGAWGCGPPVSALLACHGFWLVLIGPPTFFAGRRLSGPLLQDFGLGLILAGVCGLISVGAWEAATWLPHATDFQKQHLIQRYLFALVTQVDIPIIPVLLAGVWLGLAGYLKLQRSRTSLHTAINCEFEPRAAAASGQAPPRMPEL